MYDITVKLTVIACAYSESIIYNLIFDLPVTAHIVFIYNDVCNQTLCNFHILNRCILV